MRAYSTRTKNAGRYLAALFLLNLLYLGLMLPAVAAIMTTLVALAPSGEGSGVEALPALIGLVASGTYPLAVLVAIVGGWARYASRRYPQALWVALLPMLNIALFGVAVGMASLM